MLYSAATAATPFRVSPLEVEVAGLLKNFRDTLSRISSRETIEAHLRAAFKVSKLDESCAGALWGAVRPYDPLITVEKAKRIALRPPGTGPLECLEIASGRSLGGKSQDFGCPFPARAEAQAWEGKIRTTLTDYNIYRGCTLLFVRDGALVMERMGDFRIDDERIFSAVIHGPEGSTIEPISLQTVRQRCPAESAFQIEKVRGHLWILCDHAWEGSEPTWVLPHLSAEYEHAFYNVHEIRRDVNFYKLNESFPEKKFDIIIGRHLHIMRDEEIEALRAQISERLNPGGWAFVSADGWKRGTHEIEIGTRISSHDEVARFTL